MTVSPEGVWGAEPGCAMQPGLGGAAVLLERPQKATGARGHG